MSRPNLKRLLRSAGTVVGLGVALGAFGCLTRPVASVEPSTKVNFTASIKQSAVDKVDLLFMIDNSASMGDKQDLLREAVPDLIDQLLLPQCVSKTDKKDVQPRPPNGDCASLGEYKDEFPPVIDMHIGIVTSSLGGGGAGDVCVTTGPNSKNPVPGLSAFDRHNDDKGHLINRKKPGIPPMTAQPGVEDPVPNARPKSGDGGNFLAWLPTVEKNQGKPQPNVTPYTDAATLKSDFQALVSGTQEFGCGLEAQMESWYRFLVQPDPWNTIELDTSVNPPRAKLVGVDETLLRQRKDFLREDSLLAIIVVTDEEDSWSDPLSIGGRGWATRALSFPGSPTGLMPRGTSACDQPVDPGNPKATGPNSSACTSCGFSGTDQDPNCQISCGAGCAGFYTQADDGLNIRYTNDMKRRYGLDPQFPVQRYVDGLRSPKVPDRNGEHKDGAGPYLGDKNCTNPIYAKDLPDNANGELCNLKRGVRTPDLVFFALIGGVPWQFLTEDPRPGSTAPFKESLSEADWVRILGKDPATYQSEGIDFHMIETYKKNSRDNKCPDTAPNNCDPINGKEWDTSTSKLGLDLQYACIFDLPTPKNCADPVNEPACDCGRNPKGSFVASPLCEPNPADSNNPTLQRKGKAYPTIRELRVAKGMGEQGIVASICPRSLNKNDPDYGYRPAVRAIINRLKAALAGQCLPQPLTPQADGTVQCLILVVLPEGSTCDPAKGLKEPDPAIVTNFNKQRQSELGGDGGATLPPDKVCELRQIAPGADGKYNGKDTCEGQTFQEGPGFCYVTGAAANPCTQAIKFSSEVPGQVNLQCIQQKGGATDGGGGG
jgi:hypothetical protein